MNKKELKINYNASWEAKIERREVEEFNYTISLGEKEGQGGEGRKRGLDKRKIKQYVEKS